MPIENTRKKACQSAGSQNKELSNGFTLLVEAGLPELTGEYLVVKYRTRFPPEAVAAASRRLSKHGIQLPSD